MLSCLKTVAFSGVEVLEVEVQSLIAPRGHQPGFVVVGLPDKIIAESRERVKAALSAIALDIPYRKITVNLSPADLLKEGSHFDLPIAMVLLASLGIVPVDKTQEYLILGELSLNGDIVGVNGVLPAAVGASERELGLICPRANYEEAAWSGNQKILPASNLISLINHLTGKQLITIPERKGMTRSHESSYADMKDVVGQESAKRVMEIAAAGGHNVSMIGSPGSGKSMMASRLPGLLPPMSPEEIIETSMIYSVAGEIKGGQLLTERPFRAPHQSSSIASIVGGGQGKRVTPGEISLSHNGVLFLDEFPEFPRALIESLRQPLETKDVTVARANSHVTYPANFQLVVAMNHCKCGYFKNPLKMCSKAPRCVTEYQARISAPILDRIDLFIEVEDVRFSSGAHVGESSADIAARVLMARQLQLERYRNCKFSTNSGLEGENLRALAAIDHASKSLLNAFASKHSLSMRSYNKAIKVARTIADLEASEEIKKHHIAEALRYKSEVQGAVVCEVSG